MFIQVLNCIHSKCLYFVSLLLLTYFIFSNLKEGKGLHLPHPPLWVRNDVVHVRYYKTVLFHCFPPYDSHDPVC